MQVSQFQIWKNINAKIRKFADVAMRETYIDP